ncbi:non-ribosomal peptide synthase/polyketide synthase [Clostridium tagluense]|uniref:non-ribosomal peptide synthase/polyketide synthase n=1 Tax=Clostridium tagluense TaxID=360422 RepID=UPI001C6E583F|nr:non-ribosomal peptide synthase/polyketide synthase [Clostridium tagluense]MBW9155187.1 non-ribosomal peptide synthase/polyketide synthase [Clostridium tagluense]WLC64624.1 non-ribosomal peptide synthase/polyketide synthase [Clostridium tagluense]
MNKKIDKSNIENIIDLTSTQQGMLFHYISDDDSKEYHEQLSLTISGDVKIDLLQKSWKFVIDTNEMLRTVFRWKGIDKPLQIVLKSHEVLIQYVDITNKKDKHETLENIKSEDLNNRIDITKETLRVYLCKLDDYKCEMIISNHHILYDGWSNGIILKELMEFYNSLYEGKELRKINKTKFSEFIKFTKNLNKDEQREHWVNYLDNLGAKNDYFYCKENRGISKEISYKVDTFKTNKIKDFAKENKVSLSSLLYGAWGVLSQKLINSNEVLFGTTVSGRTENIKSIDSMVGLFINTIPLRVKSENKTTFMNLIHKVDIALNERKDFENTSLVDIKEYCGLRTNEDIFSSIVTIENYPLDLSLNKENVLTIDKFQIIEKTNYNMALEILTFEDIEFKFNFNSTAIDENMVKRLGGYLERVIYTLLVNKNIEISEVDLLAEEEKNQILYEFNDTKADYPKDKTIQELFEEQVEKAPNNIAIVFEDKKLTYKELNEKANSIARVLRNKGVKADSIVGIMVERSLEMIIGIMGILKAGGAYLPMDPSYPKERIEYMLKDSESKVLLSTESLLVNIEFDGEFIDLFKKDLFEGDSSNLEKINNSSNLAYVIYTSGTTGKPKGAMIEHKSLVNRLNWMQKKYPLSQEDVILQKTTYTFDVSVWEILWWSLVGAKVCMLAPNDEKDPTKIIEAINKHDITTMHFVPSMLDAFLYCLEENNKTTKLPSLRQVFCSGETLNSKQVSKFYKEFGFSKKLTNLYGPTEATIDVSYFECDVNDTKVIPIGKPIDNTKLYVLKDNKLLPIGVTGELYISGDGLARGYFKRSELTAEKFVENPFELGAKMYKTGDLARWLPDGNIEFLGRIDNQVKIRGFRIELGEIENRLLQHEDIKEVAVVVKESKDHDKYICAYVVCKKEITHLNLKKYLKERLPEYMVPSYFMQLEKMPLTSNGKIDRKSLPEPNKDITFNEYEAARNEIEERLVRIWSEVLGIEKVGINDNFFELGGHSLKATVVISKIHKELNREMPLKELFKSPTIKELSKFIEATEENSYSKIEKVEEREYYESSSAQKRMYMLQQFDKDSVAYNMPVVFELEGKVNRERIEETFRNLVTRHEALRTYFETIEEEIVQKLSNSYEFKLAEKKDNEDIETIINKFIRPFELEKAPLFRAELVESKEKNYLLIDMHHIISDGVSMSILIKEFTVLYNGETLESLKLQYNDFASWQNNFLKSEEMKKQEEYWVNSFNDEIPVLNLPYDYERPAMQSFEGDNVSFELDEKTTEELRKLAKETGATMHMVLLSVFNILLSKYSGQEDIVVGTPIAGRAHADLQNIMGMFVNTLALRNKPEGNKKYLGFLKEVKENSLRAYENQSYQLEALVEKLDVRRDTSRNPLFDVMFNMIDTVDGNDIELDGLLLKNYNVQNKIAKFDLTLNTSESSETLKFSLEYCTKLFNKETIERLSEHYINVLVNISNNNEMKISEIELLSENERKRILYEFNDTKVDYHKDKTIQELFEGQVEKTPNNIAIVFEDKKLTYKELNEKANSIARVLRNKGVKADSIVGIMVERSLEMIIGIMGILKAGGAYLPMDPSYPKERIEYMLKDSESKVLLSTESLLVNIEFDGEFIDLFKKDLFEGDSSNLEKINNSSNLAYVIYTSGTTGKPKGAMIEHKSLVNRLNWMQKKYPLSQEDVILQKTTYTFDVSVWEILWWSLVGAKVCMLAPNDEKDPTKIIEAINKHDITTMHFVPSMLDAFLYCLEENNKTTKLPSLRQVFCSGETLNSKQVSKFYKEFGFSKKLTNLYGPTEATIDVSYFECDVNDTKVIPIGKPIDNTKLYVLKDNKLLPIGVTGELYISGDGLARGYFKRSELTAEKFVENPFELGAKMYKTGDLARWLPDGNIEFLGRIDNQVKIRGFRIELGEIENRLLQHEDIKEVAVVVKESKDHDKYICAYVVCKKEITHLNLKKYLKERLPEYMVPSYFMQLEKMPLTSNGKIDRKSLPEPNKDITFNEYEAARNEIEERLVRIWSEVLGIEKVGINDNFFELGGHSLKATVVISKIHKELNREMPLKELFKSPTIKELSKFIEATEENSYSKIEKVEEREYYESSSAQKRMYMLQQFDKDSVAYNMPVVFELEGKVNRERIEETFRNLVTRHEALRTYFETIEEEIVQKLSNSYEFKLAEKKDNEDIETIINKFIRPFELEKAPLFRAELVESKEKNYLLIDMHHIISDGVSMSILIKEFTVLYNGETLESLKLQYNDFASWQNNFLKSEEMKKQEEYWVNSFNDEIPVLNLPYDYERPAMQSFEGDNVSFELDEKTTEELRKLAKETGATMHMVLLSVFNILLSKYSGQEDIVVGTPIAGRAHADLQNIMGMFVNTLALRNKPEGNKKYLGFLKEVKENSLRAYENQSYQLEALVEKLDVRRDTSRNPLFDVMFNMIDTVDGNDIELDGLLLKNYNVQNKIAKFDLTLNTSESSETLKFSLEYCTKLFNKETIERLSEHYINVLVNISNNNEMKISEIELLSKNERNQILYEFNDTKVEYPKDKTMQELFEEQAQKTPNNIAVVFEDKELTYKELNEKSNQLARILRNKGVKADSIVGIMVERSVEMIIGIMGILKAGGAYLPIDPSYPKERIEYMLKDSESKILLITESLIDKIEFDGQIIDLFNEDLFNGDSSNLEKINTSNDLAYVIYTSGTTGKPKGTMIEHVNLNNFIYLLTKQFDKGFSSNDRILSLTNYVFDVSVCEFFVSLISGSTLVINDKHKTFDPIEIAKLIVNNQITFTYIPPSLLLNVYEELMVYKSKVKLRKLLVGVEAIRGETLNKFYGLYKDLEIVNGYGPTESTICSTFYKITADEPKNKAVSIGKPINNTKIYILDAKNKVLPVGIAGELCISGDGLARGYINNEELTNKKFIKNPFESRTKMYKTGDLARWLADGNIEFLGRIDNQVKIRGFRIELGEIENRLLQYEDIKEATVVVKENKDYDKYICAYVVSEKDISELNLKNYLKESLPEYMVPSYFVQVEKMPLTLNGKLDRKALPEPNKDITLNEYEAARNEVEEKLVRIWSEVLGVEKIGINDNFFELGGHSLKATVLISKIHKELNREIPLKELFKSSTIKELSKFIEKAEENLHLNIEKVEQKEYYETSSAQKRMYMLQQFEKDSVAYNMPVVFELVGKVNKERIEETFRKIITRHEALRTYFETVEGEIVQKIDNSYEFKLADRKDDEEIETIINKFVRPFELDKTPLFRVELVESRERTYMLIDMHHIISDGVSMSILIKEFTALYNVECLETLKLQYKDFAAWQNNFLKSEKMKEQEEYWINRFNDEIPVLNLPYDHERPAMQSFEGDNVSFDLDEKTTEGLRKITKETGTTMHMVLLSTFNILLSKYSGQEDVVVGTPIAGRPHADFQNIMGMFVNTLALRNKPEGDKKYLEFLKEVKENCLKAYENQNYQLESLVEKLDIRRDTSRNPLFDVMFNMIDTVNVDNIKLDELLLTQYNKENKISKFDLTLIAFENSRTLEFNFEYCTKIFNKETIERLSNHYKKVLDDITKNIEMKISKIEILTENERNQILYEFNDTKADYPKNKTIQELFEEQVERTPNNIAVVFENEKLTFKELNEKANQLARILRNKGVKADSIVGIMIERSLEMIIGIMGILKAGGAYLPIDQKLPKDRIDYMTKDSKINILVTSKELANIVEFNGSILDITDESVFEEDRNNVDLINKCNDLAYVIYTSGTSGNPKGVMVEHNNVVRLMFNDKMPFKFNDKDVWTMFHSYCFDFSVWEMYGALLYGGRLVIVPELVTKNFEEYLSLLKSEKVTILNQTPTAFYNLMNIEATNKEKNLSLVYIIFGGEALNPQMLYEWKKKYNETKIINMYGITETTVHVTYKEIGYKEIRDGISNIGKPIPTLKTYVMDKNLNIQPIGVPGELCVGGDGVARGYLNRNELTEKRFVINPYIQNEKIYKSGDLVKLLENGELEYLGRIDNQVKIRGFRIELGEIENKLLQHEEIKEVAVVVKENKDHDKYICAYVVSEKEICGLNLKNYLKERLPEYMVPAYFVQIEKMLLTSNGKLDRRALPEPNKEIGINEYEAPRNEIEEKLSKVWSEVLGFEKVGINNNFFELGGHSLKATVLISKIHKELNREIPLKELFKSPTIKELSKFIENAEANPCSNIEKVGEKEYYEASSAQKRMYMLQQFDKDSVAYNMPVIFELEGKLNKERIEETFRNLVTRHEALRTYFEAIEDEIVQKVSNSYDFKLAEKKDNEDIETIINKFIRPFELEKAPLLRVELVESREKFYLLVDMHHIISDGVSMSILIKDFTDLYNGKSLEILKSQYKDFAAWQNNFLKSEEMKKQEEYWVNRFNDEIPVLNLLYDYERPVMKSFEGDSVNFELEEKTTKALKKLAKETGTTMHMVLISAFNILLSKYSGQEDIVVGTPIAGRPHADLQNIMGMFVNTLALRNKPEGDKKYLEFLKELKENSLKAYENQRYQFEALVDNLDIRRDTSRNPLFDVMFNMNHIVNIDDIELDGLLLIQYNKANKISKFDLTLNVLENSRTLEFNLEYCTKIFNKETIERLSKHYIKILDDITNNTEIKLSEIEIVTEEEKNQILYDFNDTKVDYPKDKTIQELFEEQVDKTPNNIAVIFEGEELTYKELNEKANSLARILRNKGVKADSIVGIMVERSQEMIVGIMAILKAGGAYLPIVPEYPEDRIRYILDDSKTNILLTQSKFMGKVEFNGETINLEAENVYSDNVVNLEHINLSRDLAYIIYTSGSTGKPKGVMVEHQNVVNILTNMQMEYPITKKDVYLLKTTYSFDVSVTELFGWFMGNGSLAILSDGGEKNIEDILEAIDKYKVTHINFVPSMTNIFLDGIGVEEHIKLNSLKYMFIAGEAFPRELIKKCSEVLKGVKVENIYGPTETTIYVTRYSTENFKEELVVPIGKAMYNVTAYIVDKYNKLVPIGAVAELCIGGECVTRGYLNKAELTAERFIENPFKPGTKMYKTGDLARWLPDGNIEFLGRIDNQVKIRGFRIELGEIENRLQKHKGIKEAVVIVKENKYNDKYICAYIVSEKEIKELNLKRYLKESLPEYMVPSYFMQLEKMPLTLNGKLNRKALPEPDLGAILNEYEAPRNEVEEKLSKVWNEVLGTEKVGINDNFFELGGHSLKATVLVSKIHKELNREIPLKELFKSPTIKELSKFIENKEENEYFKIAKVEEREYYEVASAQKRMYMLQQFNKHSIAYNMPAVFEFEGEANRYRIEETFQKLVLKHESLRTYFETYSGEIIQKVQNDYKFKLVNKKDEGEINDIINKFVRPFNLEKVPLFRVEIVKQTEKTYLLIDMHHIISDGISRSILINEFTELYNKKDLESLKLQYKDFAAWQNNFLKSEEMKIQEDYWINRFNDEIPVMNLQYDYRRPNVQSFEGDSVNFQVCYETTQGLRALERETGTTMHMIMLSTFNILLSRYSGQKDIVIGIPIAGRPHADLENIIGIFVNTLALRNKPEGDKKYIDFLKEVKENCLKAYENQSYQFETLVDKLDIRRVVGRNPLFDIMFNSNNDENRYTELKLDGVLLKSYNMQNKTCKCDLSLSLMERAKILEMEFVYCSKLFNKDTIEAMVDDYINILKIIINNKEITINNINLRQVEDFDYNSDLIILEDEFCL